MLLAGSALAGEVLCRFDIDSLIIPDNGFHIKYGDLSEIIINGSFSLPVYTLYISTPSPLLKTDIHVNPADQVRLTSLPEGLALFESIPTGENEIPPYFPKTPIFNLGSPVINLQPVIIAGQTYTAVSILPVTLDSVGYLTFNRIFMVDNEIAIGDFLPPAEVALKAFYPISNNVSLAFKTGSSETPGLGIDYIIITSSSLAEYFESLVEFKNATGITTGIITLDSIYAHYSGIDEAEKIRNYLKDFYQSGGRYVLLGGDDVTVPVRYVYYYNTDVQPLDPSYLRPSDLYFGDLDGEWEVDGDGVWGEPTDDSPDLIPELLVGRLPVNAGWAITRYLDKLINYSLNPGNGDFDYLTRAYFFSSDQMRDYPAGGQHAFIGKELPSYIVIDTVSGIEAPSGNDPDPTFPSGESCIESLSDGYGFVHILAHGRIDGFVVRSVNYGDWPASLLLARPQSNDNGDLGQLEKNNKTGLYYSLSCDGGAFDLDSSNGSSSEWSFAERLMAAEACGAVAYVANARWGWVYSSYFLQASFTRNLYALAEGNPVLAMHYSWLDYPYYRDLIYGQNFLGDPTIRIYTEQPGRLVADVPKSAPEQTVTILSDENPVSGVTVTIALDGTVLEQGITDDDGQYHFSTALDEQSAYTLTAAKPGYTVLQDIYVPSITLDTDDDIETLLPREFELGQNFPNPFNPVTTIRYSLPKQADVTFTIYNILGQEVLLSDSYSQPSGTYTWEWDGRDKNGREQSSGIYFYRLTTGEFTDTKKMLLIR